MTDPQSAGSPGTATPAGPDRPFPPALLRNATATAAAGAPDAEHDRRLSAGTMTALTEAGFLRHFVPRHRGGLAGTFTELLAAAAEVAEGCTSAAWCGALFAAHSRFAALLPEEAQREIWADSPDVPIAAAIAPPAGTARPAPGGWLLDGSWNCASGVDFARWVLLAAPESPGPAGEVRVLAVPREQITVKDTWHSTGMCGTGSNSVVLADTFVPHHRTIPLADLLRGGAGPGRARCHTVPAHLAGGLMFAAPALGAARRALHGWTAWAAQPHPSTGQCPLDGAAAQETLARASAEIDSAGLLLTDSARRADAGPVDEPAVARGRRDAAIAIDLLVTAVERLFRNGGSLARSTTGDLQRCWRDVHTVAAHGALRLDAAAGAFARAAAAARRPPAAAAVPAARPSLAANRAGTPTHLVFSDVDETLITCKSMLDFLDFHFAERYGPDGARRALAVRQDLAALTAAGTPREAASRAYYRAWAGERADEVEASAARWFAERAGADGFFVTATYDALRRHLAKGAVLVLVSGSFPALLEPIAARVGATHLVCTRPEVRDGLLTGRTDGPPVIGEAKREAVRDMLRRHPGVDPADCYGYGDHVSDLPMLSEVGHPVVVGDDPELLRLLETAPALPRG